MDDDARGRILDVRYEELVADLAAAARSRWLLVEERSVPTC